MHLAVAFIFMATRYCMEIGRAVILGTALHQRESQIWGIPLNKCTPTVNCVQGGFNQVIASWG